MEQLSPLHTQVPGLHRALYAIKLEMSPFDDVQWIYILAK